MLVLLSSTNLINLVNLITWLKNILILNKISKTKKIKNDPPQNNECFAILWI
jgi:hypothetical protein